MTPPKAPSSLLAHHIVRAASSPDASVAELARLAESDPAFAMRILRVVNSAAFGLKHRVTAIPQACALIGIRGLRGAALSLVVSDMAPLGREGAAALALVLRRAAAGGMIAARCGIAADEGFLVGLLLEIGILARLRDDPRATEAIHMPAHERLVFERASGMGAHMALGAELAASFELPAEIADAIAGHHDAMPAAGGCARVAWAAERIASAWEGADVEAGIEVATSSLRAIGFDTPGVEQVLEQIPAVVADAARAFGLVMEAPVQLESLRRDAARALVELNEGHLFAVRKLEALLEEKERLAADLERENAEFAMLADTDPLTGLASERALRRTMARDLARAGRSGTELSIMMVHLDVASETELERRSHLETVLRAAAALLRRTVRAGDLPACLDGQRLAVILPETSLDGATFAVDRFRAALAELVADMPEGSPRITANFGLAARTSADDDVHGLLARASAALASAMARGSYRPRATMTPPSRVGPVVRAA